MCDPTQRTNQLLCGRQRKTINIIPGCTQPTCTYQTEQLHDTETIQIIKEAYDFGNEPQTSCTNCPDNIQLEWDRYIQTRANINVLRIYELCKDPGKTIVEITIQPHEGVTAKNIRLYEYIPKQCISSLQAFLTEYTQGTVSIIAVGGSVTLNSSLGLGSSCSTIT